MCVVTLRAHGDQRLQIGFAGLKNYKSHECSFSKAVPRLKLEVVVAVFLLTPVFKLVKQQ